MFGIDRNRQSLLKAEEGIVNQLTLLFENSNFTPFRVTECEMVL
jgi:hypothetical protein